MTDEKDKKPPTVTTTSSSSEPVVKSTKRPVDPTKEVMPAPNAPAPLPSTVSSSALPAVGALVTKHVDNKPDPPPKRTEKRNEPPKRTEPKPEPAKERSRVPEPVVTSTGSASSMKPRAAFVEPSLSAVDALDCESLAICICSDVRPLAGIAGYVDWRLCGRLSDLLRKGIVTGVAREKTLVPTQGRIGPKRIFVFGWGPQKSILDGATERLAWMVDVLHTAKIERVAIALPEPAVVLLGLVDEHVRKPLGDKCALVFGPDQLLADATTKDTRPIPAPANM